MDEFSKGFKSALHIIQRKSNYGCRYKYVAMLHDYRYLQAFEYHQLYIDGYKAGIKAANKFIKRIKHGQR